MASLSSIAPALLAMWTHALRWQKVSAACCWGLISLAAGLGQELDRRGAPPGRLEVVPAHVVLTPDYPAAFSVRWTTSDGRAVDLSSDSRLAIRIGDASIAEYRDGWLRMLSPGQTQLIVERDGLVAQSEIQCQPDSQLAYTREVMATLTRSGCNLGTCHGNLHGKGGFRLSLRGDDADFDHYRLAIEHGQRRLDPWEPDESLLLRKATGKLSHQGGQRFSDQSPEYAFLRRWIEQGAPRSSAPELESLEVHPKFLRLDAEQRTARLVIQARYKDGTVRDVTRWSRIEPSIPSGISVTQDGWVTADHPMDVSLGITYLSGRSASRMVFLGEPSATAETSLNEGNPLDRWVLAQCRQLHVPTMPRADDWTLIRRLYLVTVGRLPTPEETKAFAQETAPDRVQRTVDRLLADPGFDYAWALRWSDLLRNEDKVMSQRGAALLHDWLRRQSAEDRSAREWIAELLTSTGSTYDNPPASFHRTHRDPFVAAESSAQVFLGVRLQCAKCHNHPFDVWRQDDYYGLAAYFTTIERKQIDNKPKDELDKHIITGDEIISLADRAPAIQHPGRSQMVGPNPLETQMPGADSQSPASLAAASAVMPVDSKNVLHQFATWLTEDNPQFDANLANRVWSQYFGRGIVDPPDDFRDSNPPSNPELLAFLAAELRHSGYSIKSLSRMILTSDTFAQQSIGDVASSETLQPIPYFAGYPIRRLGAEPLMDAISDATGVASEQAMRMPGVPRKPGFLTAFGKPNRLLVCECERSNAVSLGQSLVLVNGNEVREKLVQGNNRIDQLLRSETDLEQIIEELFLAALCRPPSEQERTAALALMDSIDDRPKTMADVLLAVQQQVSAPEYRKRRALEDLLWALINSKEFVLLR